MNWKNLILKKSDPWSDRKYCIQVIHQWYLYYCYRIQYIKEWSSDWFSVSLKWNGILLPSYGNVYPDVQIRFKKLSQTCKSMRKFCMMITLISRCILMNIRVMSRLILAARLKKGRENFLCIWRWKTFMYRHRVTHRYCPYLQGTNVSIELIFLYWIHWGQMRKTGSI